MRFSVVRNGAVTLAIVVSCQMRNTVPERPIEEFKIVQSWGRTRKARQLCARPFFLDEAAAELASQSGHATLAHGCGRSYGDVCLNSGGRLLMTDRLTRFIHADWERGVTRAEAGLTIGDLLKLAVPRRWFPFVTPGTKIVALGGLVANDVHGKNHEAEGTFGCHVRSIGLVRRTDGRIDRMS